MSNYSHETALNFHASITRPDSLFHKRNSREVRSLRRASKVVNNWSIAQLEHWRKHAQGKSFSKWYKYRHLVDHALAVATDDAYKSF